MKEVVKRKYKRTGKYSKKIKGSVLTPELKKLRQKFVDCISMIDKVGAMMVYVSGKKK